MKRCLNCMQEYEESYGAACPNCGYRGEISQDDGLSLKPGTILQGRYIIGTVIRVRDIDIFYNCWDALFDRRVTVQEYFPRYCATRSGATDISIYEAKRDQYQKGLKLFCVQSREMIRLYKEQDVISYHGVFQENRTAYAVMDYQEAPTLKTWLGRKIPEERDVLEIMRMAIRAVDKCHRLGIYHGMIGQDTFCVTEQGTLVLKDYGSWRYVSGKPGIVNYGKVCADTDVFSLAKMFAQIVTGMETDDAKILIKNLSGSSVHLSKPVINALRSALSYETKSLGDFCKNLDGKKGNRQKALALPHWLYLAAGAAALIVVVSVTAYAFVRFKGSGMEFKFPWAKENQEEMQEDEMVRVPNVINMDREEAEERLRESGLLMNWIEITYNEDVPEGKVFHQGKKENTLVERGTIVDVRVSMGKKKGVFPAIIGLEKEEAEQLLKDAGFSKIKFDETTEEGMPNTVLRANANADEMLELDTEILVEICRFEDGQGWAGGLPPVPDVCEKTVEDAKSLLIEQGFLVYIVEEHNSMDKGLVFAQLPEAESQPGDKNLVTLYVSLGEEKIYMKNVLLMTEKQAREEIEALGLRVGKVTEQFSDSVPKGKVMSQSVPQNQEVKKGRKIDLVISKGREQQVSAPASPKPATTAEKTSETEIVEPKAPETAETAEPETLPTAESVPPRQNQGPAGQKPGSAPVSESLQRPGGAEQPQETPAPPIAPEPQPSETIMEPEPPMAPEPPGTPQPQQTAPGLQGASQDSPALPQGGTPPEGSVQEEKDMSLSDERSV